MSDFKDIARRIGERFTALPYEVGDLGDIGNEVGIILAAYLEEGKMGYEKSDFMSGLNHGISLTDGSHPSSEEMYAKLREEYSDEEIAQSHILPWDGTDEERVEHSKKLREAIQKHRKEMGWRYRVYWYFKARYLGYKYRLQDYIREQKTKK